MSPTWMLVILVGLLAAFVYSAHRRWQLLKVGTAVNRLDQPIERLKGLIKIAFFQWKMPYYRATGIGHILIFFGFLVLLLRSIILWGRGFDPDFVFFGLLGPVLGLPLGHIYDLLKDVFACAVLLGCVVFFYYRVINKAERMTQSGEALLILVIITVMMLADMAYDGAAQVLHQRYATSVCDGTQQQLCAQVGTIIAPLGAAPAVASEVTWNIYPTPAGSLFGVLFNGMEPTTLVVVAHIGFWVHATLVLVFLNILPYSKHFHVLTVIPNVYLRDLAPAGSLPAVGKDAEDIGEKVMKAFDEPDTAEPVGISRIEHFTWKDILDFYTCTECGRCTDNCPAARTGKKLSPKHFTIDLRNHLYERDKEFLGRPGGPKGLPPGADDHQADEGDGEKDSNGDEHGEKQPENPVPDPPEETKPIDLISDVIDEEVVWACTTCRACEEQCPVMINYVDKMVDLRRNLVLVRGEFPQELAGPFQGIEVNGNPWNLARLDRGTWAEGLDIPTAAERPEAPVLFWVGCAASYDDRAKKIARALAKLFKAADVDFAILGEEENCVGDPARRAGNEYLFAMLAEMNIAVMNGYQEQGGVKTVVTACPHCFNTLKNEYPAFGGNYDVVHHTSFLLDLVRDKKLVPRKKVNAKVVFHDSCYLGRYNEIYQEPREVLQSIPGLKLVETEHYHHHFGQCCGAGGAQMFMEEQNKDRMNVQRTLQLLDTGAETIASACPFCVTMLTDGLKDQDKEEEIQQLDIAELLVKSCGLDDKDKSS